jgi:hypothetical protein
MIPYLCPNLTKPNLPLSPFFHHLKLPDKTSKIFYFYVKNVPKNEFNKRNSENRPIPTEFVKNHWHRNSDKFHSVNVASKYLIKTFGSEISYKIKKFFG